MDARPERHGPDLPGPNDPWGGAEWWEWWSSRWPTSATPAEAHDGVPVWLGGPWDDRDLEAAERLLPGPCGGAGADRAHPVGGSRHRRR